MRSRVDFPSPFRFPSNGAYKYHRPLIPVTVALGIGIIIGGTWPGHLPLVMIAGVPPLAGMGHAWLRRRNTRFYPLVLLSLLGYGLISPWLPGRFPAQHISHFTDSYRWQIEGYVTETLAVRDDRFKVILEVKRLRYGDRTHTVTGAIRVTISGESSSITPGTYLSFISRIRSFHNFNNPGGFNYSRYMTFQRVFGSAYTNAADLTVRVSEPPVKEGPMGRFRSNAHSLIDQLEDIDSRSVLKALLLGDRHAISPDTRKLFNRCGVGHLLAISGLHIGIVAGLVFGVMLRFLNRFDLILDRGWGRRGATLLAVGPILVYAVMTGLSPSTQRALIMVLAFLATYFVYHDGDTLNFLALAALVMLIWHPPAIFSISFQLSFAAVFWIVLGLSAGQKDRVPATGMMNRLKNRMRTFFLVTLWATAGTLPFVMLYFQQISLIGLLANFIFVPLIGFFVLPLGLLSLVILPLSPFTASLGMKLAGAGVSQSLFLLKLMNTIDGVAIATFVPTVLEIVCFYMALGLYLKRNSSRLVKLLLIGVVITIFVDGVYWYHERFGHRDLRVTIIDVGQGSATLVDFPGGHTMLIDGGGYTNNRFFDVGERIIAPFLRRRKIMQVDTIVLSHPGSDHMNGLVYVVKHFQPKTLLWTGDKAATQSFDTFHEEVIHSGVHVPPFHQIPREFSINGILVRILHPPPKKDGAARPDLERNSNNRSIVLKITMGACDLLLPGDIESPVEEELIARCLPALPSRILLAPHHGSRTSSSPAFLSAVDPETVIISAGWQNRFGFPHPTIVERYRNHGVEIFRTDILGAITLRTKGDHWSIVTSGR